VPAVLDDGIIEMYNLSHSGVVGVVVESLEEQIETPYSDREGDRDKTRGGSLRRKATPKSPELCDEERLCRIDRHGIARYSIDR
jgi:hypothetical protein